MLLGRKKERDWELISYIANLNKLSVDIRGLLAIRRNAYRTAKGVRTYPAVKTSNVVWIISALVRGSVTVLRNIVQLSGGSRTQDLIYLH